ncbi:hypothetical protein F7725_003956 [Dissostichus mawsoni]|uniref:Aminotransferase class I/classII large domain-containing protein n=1 Tax=Dissostichus mawsoni TaxID=36200 RepID=A0A7J5YF04_DISMA|nr:hypothetical protein F7725_003956 [Dissostichus mawsoni]
MSLGKVARGLVLPARVALRPAAPVLHRSYAAVSEARAVLESELEGIREAGTWKAERIITSKQGPQINVEGSRSTILNFCANNYLGLSSHPEVVQAGIDALNTHGAGLSSVRFICGTQDLHKNLEQKLAEFHEREDCILYASCFDANAGLFELNHASIIDGIRLCRAKRLRYKHMDLRDLETKLKEAQESVIWLINTERSGTDELLGVMDRVHIVNSTLGKALGGAAGSALGRTCSPTLCPPGGRLRPPGRGAAAGVQEQDDRRRLHHLRLGSPHLSRDAGRRSAGVSDVRSMLKLGIYVIGFSFPVVPKGKARIRVQISAAHTDQDIDQCVDAFIQTGRKHGVVS